MKKRTTTILFITLFLAGLSLLLYPLVANTWNDYRQQSLISNYKEETKRQENIDYEAEWERAITFNNDLHPSILPDSFAIADAREEDDQSYWSCLNILGDGMMGYIEIPKIDVKIPIFHTTDEEVLQQAAGHLEGSSLPVGGENTHSVLSAHRGLPSATLFTDLDRLEDGDKFLLHILDEVLCYEVDQMSIVKPEETESLAAVNGEDLVTLLTCTPYGVNSHRLLVRGHRVDYDAEAIEQQAKEGKLATSLYTNHIFWVIVGLGITAVFIIALYIYDSRKNRVKEETKE